MIYIAHRINTIPELKLISPEYGIEVDIRDHPTQGVILCHDPFPSGGITRLENFLKHFKHKMMIVNVKSERIEHEALKLLKKSGIENFFFLDSSFPMVYKLAKTENENRIALRFSEIEGLDTLENMKDCVKWVWVDCFTSFPLTKSISDKLKQWNYKICIVSPELQGHSIEKITDFSNKIRGEGVHIDAICTKHYNINMWKTALYN